MRRSILYFGRIQRCSSRSVHGSAGARSIESLTRGDAPCSRAANVRFPAGIPPRSMARVGPLTAVREMARGAAAILWSARRHYMDAPHQSAADFASRRSISPTQNLRPPR
jgi:hypothetical protein